LDKDFVEHEEPWPKQIPAEDDKQGGEDGEANQE